MSDDSHPIDLDLKKILPILAREIYTTPFAFLRENVQNAFDAIRMQIYRESRQGIVSDHRVKISVTDKAVTIRDSGIGMSKQDLQEFFWSIGKSGKHTEEAQAAGVVGTFGIGGMANFGVCSRIDVITRTETAAKTVFCWAEAENLSAQTDSVFYAEGPDEFQRGTSITGLLNEPIAIESLRQYLAPIVEYLEVPIEIDGDGLSGKPFPTIERKNGAIHQIQHGPVSIRIYVRALKNGQAEIEVEELVWNGNDTPIRCVLSTGGDVISAFQHGFMLANVPVSSTYGLGGSVDCPNLRPTAGREAVTDQSRGLVQNILAAVEAGLSEHIASSEDLSDHFATFFRYLAVNGRWELAASSNIRIFGSSSRRPMSELSNDTLDTVFFAQDTHDHAIMQAYSEKGKSVALLSTDRNRQKVERQYLTQYCAGTSLEDSVTCLRVVDDLDFVQLSFKYRIQDILRRDFFIENISVKAGELSHQAMAWVPPNTPANQMVLFLDFRHSNIKRMVELRNSLSYENACMIFVRDYILPHLEGAYPELKRRDFDMLLQRLQSSVEFFEIDPTDVNRIQQLASITNISPETLAAVLGGRKQGRPVTTAVTRTDVATVGSVVQQSSGMTLEQIRDELQFKLLDINVDAKLLDACDCDPSIGLSNYYIAMTRDAHVLYRRVFTERRPSTDFSWGGYKAGYLFYSEGEAVIYYDMQFSDLVDPSAEGARSGTMAIEFDPLIFANMVYLPVPSLVENHIVPIAGAKRFNVQHQIMGVYDSNRFEID